MLRSTRLTVTILLPTMLAACGAQQPVIEGNAMVEADLFDPVKNTTTEAMCGNPGDRAHAIGRIADGPNEEGDADYVYEVASDIAKKGCPKPKS